MSENKPKKARWPKYMRDLKPRDFIHQEWAVGDDWLAIHALPPSEVEKMGCGTKCCLVGHVRHAFGLPAHPKVGGPLPAPGVHFLNRFVQLAGYPECPPGCDPEIHASDCFEGTLEDYSYLDEMTERKAARIWAKTLKHFDYTEDA